MGRADAGQRRPLGADRVARRRRQRRRLRQRPVVPVDGRLELRTARVRLQRPPARPRLDRERVADEPVAAGQLPDLVLRRGLPRRQGRLRDCVAPGATAIPQPTAPITPGGGAQPGQGTSSPRTTSPTSACRTCRSTSTTRSAPGSSPATTAPSGSRTCPATTARRRVAATRWGSGPMRATAAARAGRSPSSPVVTRCASRPTRSRRTSTRRSGSRPPRAIRRRSSSRRARRARWRRGTVARRQAGPSPVGASRRPWWPPRSRSRGAAPATSRSRHRRHARSSCRRATCRGASPPSRAAR